MQLCTIKVSTGNLKANPESSGQDKNECYFFTRYGRKYLCWRSAFYMPRNQIQFMKIKYNC